MANQDKQSCALELATRYRWYLATDGEPYAAAGSNPGTAAASLGKAEDAAHASGDVGVMLLGGAHRHDGGAGRHRWRPCRRWRLTRMGGCGLTAKALRSSTAAKTNVNDTNISNHDSRLECKPPRRIGAE